MKYSSRFKYVISVALFLCLMSVAGSCVCEELGAWDKAQECSSVAIRVKLPEQTVVNPMTRAEAKDFEQLANMNIIISDKGIIRKRLYLDFDNMKWGDGTDLAYGTESAGVTVTYEDDENGYRVFHLTFADTYWDDGLSLNSCQFHAVANFGRQIGSEDDRDFVTGLRALEVHAGETDINGNKHCTVPTPNVMYGDIVSEETKPIIDTKPSEVTRIVTIELQRTAAMITLAMDGTDLDANIVIALDSVTLHNVPNTCQLGPGNKATRSQISPIGDFRGGMMISNGYTLVGKKRQESVSGYEEQQGYKTVIGNHYERDAQGHMSNVSSELVRPLFLFENMQGTGAPVDNLGVGNPQTMKRPEGVEASKGAIANYNNNGVCSYIEVNATYTQYDETNLTTIKSRGPVSWRFFLGRDSERDLNVERNTNYQLTLQLSGSGIGESDYSWRVDENLKSTPVVGTPDMVVGGGGEMFCVEFKDPNYSNQNMKITSTDGTFVYVYSTPNNDKSYDWFQVTEVGNGSYKHYRTSDKQMWFYVQPFLPGDDDTKTERSCKVSFTTPGGDELATVSFTQYKPVTFSITRDDLEKYPDDEDLQRALFIVNEYYKHNVVEKGDFVFYADRVDREAMPWGFSGVLLDKNQNTGFENVYHLIKPLPANDLPPTCVNHKAYAGHYLPTGKGFRTETSPGSGTYDSYIDYSNGSCMIHAAMENHFQQYYPKPAKNVTPDMLLSVTVDGVYRPGSKEDPTPEDKRYSWCVPSIVGCQLVEILNRFYKNHDIADRGFDSKYPISQWTSYWTSNSATADLKTVYPTLVPPIDGKNRSFVYQFGMGLDKIKEGDMYPARLLMPRATPIKYRLLNIRPNLLEDTATN